MCECVGVKVGSYDNQVPVNAPDNIVIYKNNPYNEKREEVAIDRCILDEIKYLWSLGIITNGCCCGHNKNQGYVGVNDKSIEAIEALGYEKIKDNHYKIKGEQNNG